MQFINIKDYKTGDTVKALNFGGPKCYKVSNRYVWAPEGGTRLNYNENSIILDPLGLVINNPNIWVVVSHQNMGTTNWRVTVHNIATGEIKTGVYPFNLQGNVYELECQPGTWVIASCGGYKIESSWSSKQNNDLYLLKGTGEIIRYILGADIIRMQFRTDGYTVNGRLVDYDVCVHELGLALNYIGVVNTSMLQQQLYNDFRSRFSTSSLVKHNGTDIHVRVGVGGNRFVGAALVIWYYVATTDAGYSFLGGKYASNQDLLDTICFYLNKYQGKNISIAVGEPYNITNEDGYSCGSSYDYSCAIPYGRYDALGSIMYLS